MAETTRRNRRADPVTLLAGIGTLLVAAYVLIGKDWLPALDFRWVLAGIAGLAGVVMLLSSLRR